MRFRLHMTFFSILFCFLFLPSWGQSQPQTSYVSKEDLTKFHWLIRLCTDDRLNRIVFESKNALEREKEVANLAENLNSEDAKRMRSFIQAVIDRHQTSTFVNGLQSSFDKICKQKPCPPIKLDDIKSWYWLIPSLRNSAFREKLFNPRTFDEALSGFELDGGYKAGLNRRISEFETVSKTIGDILCDPNVWGPCP